MVTEEYAELGRDEIDPCVDDSASVEYYALRVREYQVSVTEHVPLGGAPETVIKITLRGESAPGSDDKGMNTAAVY
jgi:hypothetical protein